MKSFIIYFLFLFFGFNTVISKDWLILKKFDDFMFYRIDSYDSLNYILGGRNSGYLDDGQPFAYSFLSLTSDAGKSWDSIWSSNLDLSKFEGDRHTSHMKMLSENIIIAGVSGGFILRTTDRGESWDTTDFELNIEDHCYALDFYQDKIGVSGFESSTFFIMTNDSGKTWRKIPKPDIGLDSYKYNIDDLVILNDSTIIASRYRYPTNRHWIFRTEDRGKTWRTYNESGNFHQKFYFYDDRTGYMGGSKRLYEDGSTVIKKTTDGGKSWLTCYEGNNPNTGGGVHDMHVFDEDKVICVNGYQILRTTDGGKNWFEETYDESLSSNFQDVAFGDDEYGLIITKSKYILSNNPLINDVRYNEKPDSYIKLYPNPATNRIFIMAEPVFNKYKILNNFGEVVKEGAGINDWIDVSDLPAGMYVVRLFNNRKSEFKNIKFIKY